MTRTACPFWASHSAISPEYLPIPVGSGAKLTLYNNILIVSPKKLGRGETKRRPLRCAKPTLANLEREQHITRHRQNAMHNNRCTKLICYPNPRASFWIISSDCSKPHRTRFPSRSRGNAPAPVVIMQAPGWPSTHNIHPFEVGNRGRSS